MKHHLRYILLLPALLLILAVTVTACADRSHDSRLEAVAAIAADSPRVAIARLDSIDPSELSARDRHFYDLLSIKARDKADYPLTSDSLILDVIDYFSTHRGSDHYPEALYYGGRVYSELGDYPTALRYFQDALEVLPEDTSFLYLRGCIVSQIAWIMNKLRLYSQAIPYIKESLHIDTLLNDTFGLAYDHKLIGSIYMHQRELDSALYHFEAALEYSYSLEESDQVLMKAYMAATYYYKNELDSSLYIIRGLPERSIGLDKNITLTYASRIYYESGLLDSAFMYAHELAYLQDATNQKTGFEILLSPGLSERLSLDSVNKYVADYRRSMETYLNKNEAAQTISQNSYYNYSKHLRDKEALKSSNDNFRLTLIIALLFILLLSAIIFFLKYRYARQALRLRETLNVVESLKSDLASNILPVPYTSSLDEMRKQLLDQVKSLAESGVSVSEELVNSKLHDTLMGYIKKSKSINENSSLWTELENFILTVSPKFRHSLDFLTKGTLTESDLQIAILVKFGITPSGMGILLSISAGAISSRRRTLSKKMFGAPLSTKEVDAVILSL